MNKTSAKRRSSGFTLMETTLAVAILVIVMAIVFPVVSALQKGLKMAELDAAARHIFIAAQNQLASLRASGDVDDFFAAPPLTGVPADYTGSDPTSLTYLSSTAHPALMSKLLPIGSVESQVSSGCYAVEFNRHTGSIYAVFYSEESFGYDTAGLPRDMQERKNNDPLLGYYGGAVLEGGGAITLPAPQITVNNAETLSVTIVTENPGIIDFYAHLSYLVTIRSAVDSAQIHTFGTSDLTMADYKTHTLLLDSLIAGSHFKEILSNITPGDNIVVTVTASYDGTAAVTLPSSASKTTNSLFANRSDNAATIAYGRHLQNLEPSVSDVSTVESATQTSDIDWSYYSNAFVPISNHALVSYDGSGLALQKLTITPNGDYAGLFGLFEGDALSNLRLEDVKVSGGKYSGGLVAYCSGSTTIKNCALYVTDAANVSAYIISGTEYIGGLVGRASTLDISNSFAAPAKVYGGNASIYMGGLIGYCGAASVIEGCYADTDLDSDASPDLGGLIGHCAAGSTVSDCYALGNLSSIGSLYFGGLVGGSNTTTYTNCYAAPTFEGTAGASTPYGFAGSLSNTYVNCACLLSSGFGSSDPTSAITPITYSVLQAWIGGDAWTSASVVNSHPYDPVLNGTPYPFPRLETLEHYNDWPDRPALPAVTSFAYYEMYSDGTTGYYATDSTGRVAVNSLSEAKGPATYDGYCLLSIGDLADRSYVFETASGEVEDWIADKGNITITMDGESMTYHVYEIPRYVLLDNGYDISNFYIYIKNMGNTYWYNPHFAKSAVNGSAARPAFGGVAIVRTARHLADIGSNIYIAYLGDIYTFRQELDIDISYYDNPDTPDPGDGWTYDVISIGKSAQQFGGVYDGRGYRITLNSDSSHHTTGLFAYTNGAIQDVNLYTSDAYTMGDDDYASGVLCGINTGTIDNCTVTFGTGHAILGAPFGTMAGNNTGTITDCVVTTSGTITLSNGYGNVGGFVGISSGTITNCFVRPGVSSYAGFTLTGHVAAGFAYSNSGTIEHCSVTGVVTGAGDSSFAGGFVYANTGAIAKCYANCLVTAFNAAGFAFTSNASGATIQNCYSMLKVTSIGTYGTRPAAGFVYNGNSGISNCYTTAEVTGNTTYTFTADTCGSDCYYLSWRDCGYHTTGIGMSMAELAHVFDDDPVNWGGADTYVYLDQYTDLTPPCPYPLITGVDHYGDWLEEPYYVPLIPMFAYYEKYSDNSYGYHTLRSDGSTALYDTLSDSKGAVTGDGYVMLSPVAFDSTKRNFTLQTSSGTYTFWSEDLGSVTIIVNGNPETYYRYSIPTYVYSNCNYASAAFYQTIVVDSVTYWYNPHFAKAAVTGAASIPAFGGTAYVRSTRQLTALGNSTLSAYWGSTFTFEQELDLDFTTYSFSISSPIGTASSAPFAGIYDGNNKTIVLNSNAKSHKNALFGYSTGTLQNTKIRTSGSFTMGASGAASGILAATNAGTIQNCSITFGADFTLTGAPFGTIAGSNTGTITNCLVTGSGAVTLSGGSNTGASFVGTNSGTVSHAYVRPGTTTYAGFTLSGTNQIAGFVYTNSGTITACSTTGTVNATTNNNRYAAGFVFTNTGAITGCYANCLVTGRVAAGFAYTSSAAAATIQNCYAMIDATGYDKNGGYAAGFVYQGGSGISNCYAAAQVSANASYTFSYSGSLGANCYYLSWIGCGSTATGTAATLATLQSVFSAGPWGGAATYVYQNRYTGLPSACPYPLITDLDHYGDWIP